MQENFTAMNGAFPDISGTFFHPWTIVFKFLHAIIISSAKGS